MHTNGACLLSPIVRPATIALPGFRALRDFGEERQLEAEEAKGKAWGRGRLEGSPKVMILSMWE